MAPLHTVHRRQRVKKGESRCAGVQGEEVGVADEARPPERGV
uniref:Uncharacterized protein n=1 Tax=Arundo donax TaxID=35708 RepID=A0A0A9EJH2_ARUDO